MPGNYVGGSTLGQQYRGTSATKPPSWNFNKRDPNIYDINYALGDLWMNTNPDDANYKEVWVLVSLVGDGTSKGAIAEWVPFGGAGGLDSLTGDTGGTVFGDANRNIFTLSGIANLSIDGDPGTHTLTWNSSGGGPLLETLTPDVGGAVSPDANGNINQFGTPNQVVTTGNPGTHTITWSLPNDPPCFGACISGAKTNVTGDGTAYVIQFDQELWDFGGNYDHTTGLFTAPFDGIYTFGATVTWAALDMNMTDGFNYFQLLGTSPAAGVYSFFRVNPYVIRDTVSLWVRSNGALIVPMDAGDQMRVVTIIAGSTQTAAVSAGGNTPNQTQFFGSLIRAL